MRYPACEKLEIIRLVEQSHLPVRPTLEKLGIEPQGSLLVRSAADGGKALEIGHQGRGALGSHHRL